MIKLSYWAFVRLINMRFRKEEFLMKRFIAIFMAALFAATVFVGCGKTNPEGKYFIKTINGKTLEDQIKDEGAAE